MLKKLGIALLVLIALVGIAIFGFNITNSVSIKPEYESKELDKPENDPMIQVYSITCNNIEYNPTKSDLELAEIYNLGDYEALLQAALKNSEVTYNYYKHQLINCNRQGRAIKLDKFEERDINNVFTANKFEKVSGLTEKVYFIDDVHFILESDRQKFDK